VDCGWAEDEDEDREFAKRFEPVITVLLQQKEQSPQRRIDSQAGRQAGRAGGRAGRRAGGRAGGRAGRQAGRRRKERENLPSCRGQQAGLPMNEPHRKCHCHHRHCFKKIEFTSCRVTFTLLVNDERDRRRSKGILKQKKLKLFCCSCFCLRHLCATPLFCLRHHGATQDFFCFCRIDLRFFVLLNRFSFCRSS